MIVYVLMKEYYSFGFLPISHEDGSRVGLRNFLLL